MQNICKTWIYLLLIGKLAVKTTMGVGALDREPIEYGGRIENLIEGVELGRLISSVDTHPGVYPPEFLRPSVPEAGKDCVLFAHKVVVRKPLVGPSEECSNTLQAVYLHSGDPWLWSAMTTACELSRRCRPNLRTLDARWRDVMGFRWDPALSRVIDSAPIVPVPYGLNTGLDWCLSGGDVPGGLWRTTVNVGEPVILPDIDPWRVWPRLSAMCGTLDWTGRTLKYTPTVGYKGVIRDLITYLHGTSSETKKWVCQAIEVTINTPPTLDDLAHPMTQIGQVLRGNFVGHVDDNATALYRVMNQGTPAFSSVTKEGGGIDVNGHTGEFTFTPKSDFCGIDSFELELSDGKGGSVTKKITISVNDDIASQKFVKRDTLEIKSFLDGLVKMITITGGTEKTPQVLILKIE